MSLLMKNMFQRLCFIMAAQSFTQAYVIQSVQDQEVNSQRNGRARGGGPPDSYYGDTSCGILRDLETFRQGKILGGIDLRSHIPWQASIQETEISDQPQYHHVCGGVMISHQFVLTAAHCIQPFRKYRIVIGELNLHHVESDTRIFYVDSTDIKIHRRYGEIAEYGNDIAVIKIHKDGVTLDQDTHPVCMPNWKDWEKVLPEKTKCLVSGWGQTSQTIGANISPVLKAARVPIQKQSICENTFNAVYRNARGGDSDSRHPRRIHYGGSKRYLKSMLCAGTSENGSQDACHGDSGGPLACEYNGRYYLVGIVSWGISCGEKTPGIYTRVSHYLDWIENEKQLLRGY